MNEPVSCASGPSPADRSCEHINEAARRPVTQGLHSAAFPNCHRKAGEDLMRALAMLGGNRCYLREVLYRVQDSPVCSGLLERHQRRREGTACEGGCLCNPLPGKSTGSSLCKPFHSCDGVGEEVTLTLVFFSLSFNVFSRFFWCAYMCDVNILACYIS